MTNDEIYAKAYFKLYRDMTEAIRGLILAQEGAEALLARGTLETPLNKSENGGAANESK